MRGRRLAVLVGVALTLALLTSCTRASLRASAPPTPVPNAPAASTMGAGAGSDGDRYVHLARALQQRGLGVWFETDLVARWQEGPQAFATAIERVTKLAGLPGVRGLKIADELGYGDGLTSPAEARRFLTDVERAVHKVASSTQLLVDMVVPELGCLPWQGGAQRQCAQSARAKYPAATEAAATSYLETGAIDTLDLSTGLLDDATYQGWGVDLRQAQQQIWAHVSGSLWPTLTHLQSRKALAGAGGYAGSASDAAADVATYVDEPVAAGAGAVDIWTWRQLYDGQTVSLLGPGLSPNPLWTGLRDRHDRGVRLITHMSPSTMPAEPAAFGHECDTVAQVFDEVFVAAGTG